MTCTVRVSVWVGRHGQQDAPADSREQRDGARDQRHLRARARVGMEKVGACRGRADRRPRRLRGGRTKVATAIAAAEPKGRTPGAPSAFSTLPRVRDAGEELAEDVVLGRPVLV